MQVTTSKLSSSKSSASMLPSVRSMRSENSTYLLNRALSTPATTSDLGGRTLQRDLAHLDLGGLERPDVLLCRAGAAAPRLATLRQAGVVFGQVTPGVADERGRPAKACVSAPATG